jgi:hypothetical protein
MQLSGGCYDVWPAGGTIIGPSSNDEPRAERNGHIRPVIAAIGTMK